MKQLRFLGCLPAFCLLALPVLGGQSVNELKLGSGAASFGGVAEVPLTLSTTDQVQGLVAVFEWDAAAGTGEDLVTGPAIASADTIVKRIGSNFMVLGVVMDSDGSGGEVISPGNDQLVATARIRTGTQVGPFPVTFVDGKYASVDVPTAPLLDNIVVVGGLSIGAGDGLTLTPGQIEPQAVVNRFYIEAGAKNTTGACGDAKVLMDNDAEVEGYVVALCHVDADLTLNSVSVGAAATAQSADFTAADVFGNGGTLGVVIDLVAPFTNNTIPAGEAQHIATYNYCCESLPAQGQPATTTALTFCDNVLGTPVKENVIVVGGLSLQPRLDNGTFTCEARPPECVPTPCTSENDDGIDNDCDGQIDEPGECVPPGQMFACGGRKQGTDGLPEAVEGSIGSFAEVCFFYKSPEDNLPGAPQPDHIQGFSMALTYCCDVSARESFDITGTIVEAVGAEFVSVQADNDSADGDGCELIIGVLVDALPPFDGATLPPTDTLMRVGCVVFDVRNDEALCGNCCPIQFTDGVNARGKVPIKNLISVENVSVSPQTMNCELCIEDREKFFRGDCNFSRMGNGMAVDIADAAAVVSFLFLPGTMKFQPPCLDACDCNDDGRIDLADAVCILQYLFQFGRFPPAPGPGLRVTGNPNPNMVEPTPAGLDPTDDKIDCAAGGGCD